MYSETLSYDAMARPTETSLTRVSDGALLFDSKRAYDAVGNVADVWTTLPSGTDYQAFCYDEQNRLTWASSASGTVPCGNGGGSTWTAGSLASAGYTHTYTYDALSRLTSGPGGSYTYGDPHHLDAATAILGGGGGSSSYTASYDAAGDMTCRAPTSATTCAGQTQTGAQLSYDNERRLASWQNAPTNPTSSTSNLYDGEGNRVEQQVTNGAATTTITYFGALEELSTTAGVTTTTTSYYAGAQHQRIAQAVNGAFSYLGSDNLGSAQVVLDGNGNPQASALYDPYGNTRYSSGTMPGSYGFTGQHADAATGLDYYNARYYDPTAGQFTSADSTAGDGLNRYGYVRGNPETFSDPTGNARDCQQFDDCTAPTPPPSTGGCTSENCGGTPPSPAPPPSGSKSGGGNPGGGGSRCSSKCTSDALLTNQGGSGDICLDLGCATQHPPVSFDTCTDTDDGYCAYGDDSTSLFSLISSEFQGMSPTWITAIGDKGLKWLIGAFKDIEAAGDKIFGNLEVAAANAAWIGGLIAGLFGAGVAAGTYGVELWIDQQQFDHTLDDVIGRLQGLDYAYNHGQAAWVQNARFMVQTHYSGCLGCAPAGFEDVSVSVQTWMLDPPQISV